MRITGAPSFLMIKFNQKYSNLCRKQKKYEDIFSKVGNMNYILYFDIKVRCKTRNNQ